MRTFSSSFTNAITNGGSIYWMVIVEPNTIDTFLPMVFGNIIQSSLSGYSVMSGRLIDITDIDQSIDILGEYIAKTPDVQFKIQNIDGAIILDNFIGRTCTIRLGLGQTMSIASSEIFFTGKISDFKNTGFELDVTAKGMLSAFDTEMGTIFTSGIEKDNNQIIPIAHGAWIDEYAGVPSLRVFNGGVGALSIIQGEKPIYDEENADIMLYDDSAAEYHKLRKYDKTGNNLYLREYVKNIPVLKKMKHTGSFTSSSVYGESGGIHKVLTSDNSWFPSRKEDERLNPVLISIDGNYYNAIYKDNSNGIYVEKHGDGIVDIKRGLPIYVSSEDENDFMVQFIKDIECDSVSNFMCFSGYRQPVSEYIIDYTYNVAPLLANMHSKLCNGTTFFDSPISTSYDLSTLSFDMALPFKTSLSGNVLKAKLLIEAIAYPSVSSQEIDDYGFYAKFGLAFDNVPDKNMHYTNSIGILSEIINDKTDIVYINNFEENDESDSSWKEFDDVSVDSFFNKRITFYSAIRSYNITNSDNIRIAIKRRGIRIVVETSSVDSPFYYRGYGRKHPGGYYNGVSGDLIENPSIIIEDFCRTTARMNNSNIDKASFDNINTLRSDWKMATCIFSGMKNG